MLARKVTRLLVMLTIDSQTYFRFIQLDVLALTAWMYFYAHTPIFRFVLSTSYAHISTVINFYLIHFLQIFTHGRIFYFSLYKIIYNIFLYFISWLIHYYYYFLFCVGKKWKNNLCVLISIFNICKIDIFSVVKNSFLYYNINIKFKLLIY